MSDFLFEKLAEVAHLIWARWAMYAEEHNDAEHRQRWRIQARTLYADLSESEKESDREIARQWIAAMGIGQCAEVQALQARIAELEPDAKLGRMVKQMPRNAKLGHEGQQWGEWYAFWPGNNHREYGPTPEAALEAARKEETQCDRCGLKLAHEPTPGINYGPVVTTYYPPVVTNAPDQPAQVTFYPQEVIYTPGELSQYPSKTVGEP